MSKWFFVCDYKCNLSFLIICLVCNLKHILYIVKILRVQWKIVRFLFVYSMKGTFYMFCKWLRYLGVLGCVLLVGGNVGSLGGISGQSLVLVPCIPLGLALQIQCTRLGGVVVTNSSLLVETVELQELIVGGGLGEALGFLGGGSELRLEM